MRQEEAEEEEHPNHQPPTTTPHVQGVQQSVPVLTLRA